MIAMSFRSRHISCVKIYPGIENKRGNSNEYYEERLDVIVVELLPRQIGAGRVTSTINLKYKNRQS